MKLHLSCRACKHTLSHDTTFLSPFLYRGYDSSLEWSDFVDTVPDLANSIWQRSDVVPGTGESRLVRIHYPFSQSSGEKFWSLYQPALSSINGWSEYPEEIDASAFVECEVTDIASSTPHEAWARVTVSRVIMVRDAFSTLPVNTESPDFITEYSWQEVTPHANWLLLESSYEGDFGESALVRTVGDKYHLVLFSTWGLHESTAYLGNVLQSAVCF